MAIATRTRGDRGSITLTTRRASPTSQAVGIAAAVLEPVHNIRCARPEAELALTACWNHLDHGPLRAGTRPPALGSSSSSLKQNPEAAKGHGMGRQERRGRHPSSAASGATASRPSGVRPGLRQGAGTRPADLRAISGHGSPAMETITQREFCDLQPLHLRQPELLRLLGAAQQPAAEAFPKLRFGFFESGCTWCRRRCRPRCTCDCRRRRMEKVQETLAKHNMWLTYELHEGPAITWSCYTARTG